MEKKLIKSNSIRTMETTPDNSLFFFSQTPPWPLPVELTHSPRCQTSDLDIERIRSKVTNKINLRIHLKISILLKQSLMKTVGIMELFTHPKSKRTIDSGYSMILNKFSARLCRFFKTEFFHFANDT